MKSLVDHHVMVLERFVMILQMLLYFDTHLSLNSMKDEVF